MPDDRTDMSDVQAQAPVVTADKKPGFFATTTGRVVAIIGALSVLGIIAGIAAAILLHGIAEDVVDELESQVEVTTTPEQSGAVSTGTVEASGPAREVAYSEVFTFRDIFDPLLKPLPEPATPTTTTPSATDTETPYAQGVLYLDGVVTEDGILKAQLRFNGQSYTLEPGERIPNTPWQVLRVSSTSVTMLYGEVQVTLAVGQGITK